MTLAGDSAITIARFRPSKHGTLRPHGFLDRFRFLIISLLFVAVASVAMTAVDLNVVFSRVGVRIVRT